MWRVDYIHDKGEPASLELLGSRAVLGIAESLAGPDFVPTYESMVLKAAGDGAPVPWHQDAVHRARTGCSTSTSTSTTRAAAPVRCT